MKVKELKEWLNQSNDEAEIEIFEVELEKYEDLQLCNLRTALYVQGEE